jgi:signal transduction histidine kinase
LNNVARHANASEVWLRLRVEERRFFIEIADNGRGFDPLSANVTAEGGEGLGNMQSRVAEVNGEFELKSALAAGTAVRIAVTIPT